VSGVANIPGASAADLAALQSTVAELQTLLAQGAQFVSAASMTVDDLFANFPANSSRRGRYARLSNYGGFVDRVVRCDYDSGLNLYFWNPTQAEYGRTIPITADMVHYALKSPTSLNLTGTIPVGVTRTINIDPANRRPGEIIEIRNSLSSILGTLNIIGTGIGTVLSNLIGGYQKYMFDGASGSLQLVRLQ
jgi:hypothetical protein